MQFLLFLSPSHLFCYKRRSSPAAHSQRGKGIPASLGAVPTHPRVQTGAGPGAASRCGQSTRLSSPLHHLLGFSVSYSHALERTRVKSEK